MGVSRHVLSSRGRVGGRGSCKVGAGPTGSLWLGSTRSGGALATVRIPAPPASAQSWHQPVHHPLFTFTFLGMSSAWRGMPDNGTAPIRHTTATADATTGHHNSRVPGCATGAPIAAIQKQGPPPRSPSGLVQNLVAKPSGKSNMPENDQTEAQVRYFRRGGKGMTCRSRRALELETSTAAQDYN